MTTNTPHSEATTNLSVFVGNETALRQTHNPLSDDLVHAFEKATGWVLGFKECSGSAKRRKKPGMQESPATGVVEIVDMSAQLEPEERPLRRANCDHLVKQIGHLVNELQQTRLDLQSAQAELATQVPVVVNERDSEQLSELLAGLLDAAARSVGLSRADLYLLDQNTEFLNLRAKTGPDAYVQSHRLLATCPADVEALAGHAIAISEPIQSRIWCTPEECASAVCVPVSSMNAILGSLWVMGDEPRQFSDAEVNVIEIIAGRIAAELERAAMIRQHVPAAATSKSTQATAQREQLVRPVDPPFDGWSFDGLIGQREGRYIDWDVNDEEQLSIQVGRDDEANFVACFIDPLSCEVQLKGHSDDVQFWLYDADNVMLQRVTDAMQIERIVSGQSLIASTTSSMECVSGMIAAQEYQSGDDFLVELRRR